MRCSKSPHSITSAVWAADLFPFPGCAHPYTGVVRASCLTIAGVNSSVRIGPRSECMTRAPALSGASLSVKAL